MRHRPEWSICEASEKIRSFYDRYPYPPPVDSLQKYSQLWEDPYRRRADFHLFWPGKAYREDHSILIAGCGTSQAAKHALRWPNAQVTGIDISATSVRCTQELKRRYNLRNLTVHQVAIQQVDRLGTSFDQIVCTGVLHHLPAPDEGLAALRDVLKLDGAMHLMVYAPYGRTGIYMLQEFCRRVGISATDLGIRDLISALRSLPPGHPLEHIFREAPDFRQKAALADALLNPQDCAYSVPQLFDFLDKGKLILGRWVRQAPYVTHCGAMAQIPQASRIAQLAPEEQYATAELFRGTMVRHSVIVYRNDGFNGNQAINFSGDMWLGYVPIRTPDTIFVKYELPTAAEGVLINRNHTYSDIFVAVDSTRKCLLDAVDGKRTVSEISEGMLPSLGRYHRELSRSFFEQLWWHDQVVFDTSRLGRVHANEER